MTFQRKRRSTEIGVRVTHVKGADLNPQPVVCVSRASVFVFINASKDVRRHDILLKLPFRCVVFGPCAVCLNVMYI